jgi:hypothetical protein
MCLVSQLAFLSDIRQKLHLNSRLRERSQLPSPVSLCCHPPSTSHQRDLLFLVACQLPFLMSLVSALLASHARTVLDALKKLSLVSDDVLTKTLCPPLLLLQHPLFLRNSGIWLHHPHRLLPLCNTPSDISRLALLHQA